MPGQVHRVMQHPQDLSDFDVLVVAYAENHEMPASSATPGDMQRKESFGDVVARACGGRCQRLAQLLKRSSERLRVGACLSFTKLLGAPTQDVLDVCLRGSGETDSPAALHR